MPTDFFSGERRHGIGGSDVHHLFNLEPWGCSRRLFYDKRAEPTDEPEEEKPEFKRGHRLEPLVVQEYAEATGRTVHTHQPLNRHREYPQLFVHVDAMIEPPPASQLRGLGVLESKTAARAPFFKMKRQGLPAAYIVQLQHAMFVTGALWGAYAVMWPDGWQLLWWDEVRDEALCLRIRDEALKFWALVENGPAPDRLDIDSAQCHGCPYGYACRGEEMERLLARQGQGTEVDATLAPLVREYLETRDLRDQAEEVHKGAGEELKAGMGDRVLVEVPDAGKVQYKPNLEWDTALLAAERPEVAKAFRTKWDLTALGKAHPELESRFKRPGLTRPLRVYPTKGVR